VAAGSFVHIKEGEVVLIDEQTVDLAGIFVEGTLGFLQGSDNPELRSAYILVTGDLLVGCRTSSGTVLEFTSKATITLVAPENYGASNQTPDNGVLWGPEADSAFPAGMYNNDEVKNACLDRGLVVTRSGRLMIYGKDRGVSWTELNASAAIGDTQITVVDDPFGGWKQDDELVLASTDFEYVDPSHLGGHAVGYTQGEELTVSTTPMGTTIDLVSPLAHGHFGEDIDPPPTSPLMHSIPVRAEVGLLTRNVLIRGEESALSSSYLGQPGLRHRGHIMMLDDNPTDTEVPFCEVQWAEFFNLGIEATIRRYPFHWHVLGDSYDATSSKPFLKHCSIHQSVNRFLSVHNTKHVIVEDNVGYDCQGIGFYLEDSPDSIHLDYDQVQDVEMRNNLGLKVDRVPANIPNNGIEQMIFDVDQNEPPVFWQMHPYNQVEGNHAAGAAGHGFYLIPQKGKSFTHDGSTYFRDNVAHSNGQHGFYHNARPRWIYDPANGDLPAAQGLMAYKNRRFGVWWRSKGRVHLEDLRLADNKSGIYPASEGSQDPGDVYGPPGGPNSLTAYMTIDDVTIFGETLNVGEPATLNNPAEAQAQRSLPQTYLYFQRPDGSTPFSSPWDTVSGIECYDGLVDMTNFEIAFFQDTLDLLDPEGGLGFDHHTAGITQVEYDSAYAEDPRNRLSNWTIDSTTVDHPAYFRTPAVGASMIWSTVIVDQDGSLGYGTNHLLSYQDSFFAANSNGGTNHPLDQLTATPDAAIDYAQIEIDDLNTGNISTVDIRVRDASGVSQTLAGLKSTVGSLPGSRRWATNLALGLTDADPDTQRTGIYYVEFPGAQVGQYPSQYEITLKFAEDELLETVIAVPWMGGNPQIVILNGVAINPIGDANSDGIVDERDLLFGGPVVDAYFVDLVDELIFLKTTSVISILGGDPEIEGTENAIRVQ